MTWRAQSISPCHTGTIGLAITSTSGYVDVEEVRFSGAAIGVSGTPIVVTVASGGAAVTGTLSASSSTKLSSTLDVAGITTLADDLLMSEDAAALTHTGTTGLAITSTSGYVDVEDLRFTGAQIGTSNISDIITVSDAGVVINGSLSSTSLSFDGDFVVGADKFTVEASSGNTAVAGTLAVAGAFTPASLGVSGAATVGTTLTVTGDFVVGADKFTAEASSGNTTVAGTLAVGGNTTLSTLKATGAADLSSTLVVAGAATMSTTLDVTGAAALASSLAVTGTATLSDSLDVSGASALSATLAVTGATGLSSTLAVSGTTTMADTLAVTGATALASTLEVSGAAIMSTTLGVTGGTTLSSSLDVTGAATLSSSLAVTGIAALSSALAVAGITTLADLGVNGNLSVGTNQFTVDASSGNTAVAGTLAVAGITTLADDLLMSENTAALTHNGSSGLEITSTGGYVDVEDIRFTGLQIGTANTPKVITVSDLGVTVTGSLSTDDLTFTGDFVIGADKFKVGRRRLTPACDPRFTALGFGA